jgi:hypothetical protein
MDMKKTVFNPKLWNLSTFSEIGYEKQKKKLYIFYHNGEILEFNSVPEKFVFQLIISTDKEALIDEKFKKLFSYQIHHEYLSQKLC